jgi:glyoxylase-like metal-dependent hydrolase (beta-lactamase superfamily II)
MLLGQSGLRTLPEAIKLQDAELVRAASLGEAAVLAGPGGIFYVSREGQPIRLGGSEAGAIAASWHPDGCVCLVTGRGGRLFGILDGQLLPIPAETSRDLLSAAWGEGYALVGGSGVLYLFDGHGLLELEAPHVTSWQSIAYRGSGEFLASTPLGLILVKASYAPSKPLDSVVLDRSPTARESRGSR